MPEGVVHPSCGFRPYWLRTDNPASNPVIVWVKGWAGLWRLQGWHAPHSNFSLLVWRHSFPKHVHLGVGREYAPQRLCWKCPRGSAASAREAAHVESHAESPSEAEDPRHSGPLLRGAPQLCAPEVEDLHDPCRCCQGWDAHSPEVAHGLESHCPARRAVR